MKSPLEAAACAVNVGILRAASLFVPHAGAWSGAQSGAVSFGRCARKRTAGSRGRRSVRLPASALAHLATHFVCGGSTGIDTRHKLRERDRSRCALFQSNRPGNVSFFWLLLVGASYGLARILPGVRAERSLPEVPVRSGLVLIENNNNDDSLTTISSGQFEAWKERKQEFFDGFAFYRVSRESVNLGPVSKGWGVASASSNLFALMGLPVRFRQTGASARRRFAQRNFERGCVEARVRRRSARGGQRGARGFAPGNDCRRGARRPLAVARPGGCMAAGAGLDVIRKKAPVT